MILWTLISFGLFGGTFWGSSDKVRRNCSIALTAWLIFSVAMLLIGIDPNGHD